MSSTQTGNTPTEARPRPVNRGNFASDPALAAEAGRKGGRSVPPGSRSFSQDRSLAAQAGRKGGQRSHGGRATGATQDESRGQPHAAD